MEYNYKSVKKIAINLSNILQNNTIDKRTYHST